MTGFWDSKSMRNRELDYDKWLEPDPPDDVDTLARDAFEEAEERRMEEHLEREAERRHGVFDD